MKHYHYQIPGSFGKKKIDIDLRANENSDRLIILLHGAFGYVYHIEKTKYEILSEKLSKVHPIGFYQTSRNFEWREKPELSFEEYRIKAFKNKTFKEEYNDVKKAYQEIVNKYKKTTQRRKVRICLVGFSLGGIMSFLLTRDFDNIDKIYTFGTAITFNNVNKKLPVIGGIPRESELCRIIQKFEGDLTIAHGSCDELASREKVAAIFESAENARSRTLIELKGADHQFKTIDGKNKEKELINWMYNLIKKGLIQLWQEK